MMRFKGTEGGGGLHGSTEYLRYSQGVLQKQNGRCDGGAQIDVVASQA